MKNFTSSQKKFEADIVKSDWYLYWTENNFSRKENRISAAKTFKVTNVHQDKSLLRINPSVWSAIYKTDFLKNIRFLETPGASYQDLSFSFKVFALAGRVVLTDNAYVYYRQDNTSSSIHAKNKIYCVCDEYAEIDRFLDAHPELKSELKMQEEINRYTGYLSSVLRLDESLRPEFIKVFSQHFKSEYDNLTPEFYKKVRRADLEMLVKLPEKYLKNLKNIECIRKFRRFRKSIISIHFRDGKFSILLFGKKIL